MRTALPHQGLRSRGLCLRDSATVGTTLPLRRKVLRGPETPAGVAGP